MTDDKARRLAASDFEHNLIVTAGAGTGKTSLLVERILNWVVGQNVPLNRLAAITFTKKAAAELRSRLASSLEFLASVASRTVPSEGEPNREAGSSYDWLRRTRNLPDALVLERCTNAIAELDGARVSTIHGLCTDLLREHAREAGLPPDFVVDDGLAFDNLFEEFWPRALREELQAQSPRAALWERILPVLGIDALLALCRRLCSFQVLAEDIEAQAPWYTPNPTDLLGPRALFLETQVQSVLEMTRGMNPNMANYVGGLASLLHLIAEGDFQRFVESVSEFEFKERLPSVGVKLSGVNSDELKSLATEVVAYVREVARVDEPVIDCAMRALLPLVRQFQASYTQSQWVGYDGLLRHTHRLLACHPNVREKLKAQLRGLLVDEFQDTDPLQYEIVLWLAEKPGAQSDDAYQSVLEAGKLFIVGDPKQSIYRFRGADISAYKRAVVCIARQDCHELPLSANFRSTSSIIASVNALFENYIGPLSDYEPAYHSIYAARSADEQQAGGEPSVELWTLENTELADERRLTEGSTIARWITANAGPGKRWRFGDIAILFRAMTKIDRYLQPLRKAGIPLVTSGGRTFADRPESAMSFSLLHALANPNDAISLLAVLRSPLGAVPDSELLRYAESGRRGRPARWNYEAIPDLELFPNMSRTFGWLRRLRRATLRLPAGEAIRQCLEEIPLLELNAAAFEGAQRVVNIQKVLRRCVTLAEGQGVGLERVVRLMEAELGHEDRGQESQLADETLDAVRLMTIHKAKGLEFPVVILPDLARSSRTGSPGEAAVLEEIRFSGRGPLWAVDAMGSCSNSLAVFCAEQEEHHSEAEEKRLFYVACTRARDRLVLINGDLRQKEPWVQALRHWNYDAAASEDGELLCNGNVTHRRVAESGLDSQVVLSGELPDFRTAVENYRRAVAAVGALPRQGIRHPSEAKAVEPTAEILSGTPAQQEFARQLGEVVHEALEAWDFGSAERLLELVGTQISRVDVEPEIDLESLESEAKELLRTFAFSEACEDLRRGEVLGREVPMLLRDDEGQVWQGVIDLLLRVEGQWMVVDYKTDRVDGDVQALASRYRAQLALYATAVQRAFQLAALPKCRLIFLRPRIAVDLL